MGIAEKYDSTSGHYDQRYREIQFAKYKMALSFFDGVGGDILDVGCGTGLLAEFLGRKIWGIDISKGMLRMSGDRMNYVHGDATDLPFDDLSFDHVFSFTVLQNIADYKTALLEIKRVMRRDGKCALTFLNKDKFKAIGDEIEKNFMVRDSFAYSEDVFYICSI